MKKNFWFTSDTHFGHKRIPLYAKRKLFLNKEESKSAEKIWNSSSFVSWSPSWNSIKKMNEHLINKINQYVKKDDVLWHLGDFCFAKKEELESSVEKYLSQINCKNVFLIRGNHDDPKIYSYFKESYDVKEIIVRNKLIVMNHYAQAVWRKSHSGSWMLYGHSHSTAENWLDQTMPGRLSMDVGVDNVYKIKGEYRPISFEEIEEIFLKRSGNSIDKNEFS